MTTFCEPNQFCLFSDRAVLRISGEGRLNFLQGLITNDLDDLDNNQSAFAALLSPQGKVLFDFFAIKTRDFIFIDCAASSKDDLLKRLNFYKLRAKVTIEDVSHGYNVGAIWRDHCADLSMQTAIMHYDHRSTGLRWRFLLPADSREANARLSVGSADDYHAHRISIGVPEGGKDFSFGEIFPHDACFDLLHGVDFRKGCFVGQEVVSRMQHRGTARTRVVKVEAQTVLSDAHPDVTADGFPVGRLGSVEGARGVALARIDRLRDALASKQTLMAGDIPVTLTAPVWANYTLHD